MNSGESASSPHRQVQAATGKTGQKRTNFRWSLAIFAMLMTFMSYIDRVNLAVTDSGHHEGIALHQSADWNVSNGVFRLLCGISNPLGHVDGVFRPSPNRSSGADLVVDIYLLARHFAGVSPPGSWCAACLEWENRRSTRAERGLFLLVSPPRERPGGRHDGYGRQVRARGRYPCRDADHAALGMAGGILYLRRLRPCDRPGLLPVAAHAIRGKAGLSTRPNWNTSPMDKPKCRRPPSSCRPGKICFAPARFGPSARNLPWSTTFSMCSSPGCRFISWKRIIFP